MSDKILTVEQIQMIADEFGCETSFFYAENAAHVGWDPKMGDVYDSHEALRARLAEVEHVAAERLTMMRGKDAELTALRQTTAAVERERDEARKMGDVCKAGG